MTAKWQYKEAYEAALVTARDLKAENARLLNDNARLQEVVTDDELHMRKVLEENGELRKFATETWELLTCNEPVFVWKGLQELARNLGIEVDE